MIEVLKKIGKAAQDNAKSKDEKGGGMRTFQYKPVGANAGSFKRGGPVKKTGWAKVHRGEQVLNKRQAKQHRKSGRGK